MWYEDCEIDTIDLKTAAKDVLKKHAKYLDHRNRLKSDIFRRKHTLETLEKDLELYYSGQAEAEVYKKKPFPTKLKTKAAVDKHVQTDPDVLKHRRKIDYAEIIIDDLEKILKEISNMNFLIKSIIEIEKFQQGEF